MTTKEQDEQIKQLIKYLKKKRNKGKIKILEVNREGDLNKNDYHKMGEFLTIKFYEEQQNEQH